MNGKYLPVVAAGLSLAACQHQPPAAPNRPAAPQISYADVPEPVGDRLLARREALCSLPLDEQGTTLRRLDQAKSGLSRPQQFERLLLASCRPDLTPGLLREALVGASAIPDLADSERRLIQMIKDFDLSYRQFEEKNAQLKSNLTKTINGIRDIENETDNLPHGKEQR